jgi:hypothetical protein
LPIFGGLQACQLRRREGGTCPALTCSFPVDESRS